MARILKVSRANKYTRVHQTNYSYLYAVLNCGNVPNKSRSRSLRDLVHFFYYTIRLLWTSTSNNLVCLVCLLLLIPARWARTLWWLAISAVLDAAYSYNLRYQRAFFNGCMKSRPHCSVLRQPSCSSWYLLTNSMPHFEDAIINPLAFEWMAAEMQ